MKKTLLSLLAIVGLSFTVFGSSWHNIQSTQIVPAKAELVSSNLNTTTIHYSLGGFDLEDVTTIRGVEKIVDVPSSYPLHIEGAPDLKRISVSLIIPNYGSTTVNVIAS